MIEIKSLILQYLQNDKTNYPFFLVTEISKDTKVECKDVIIALSELITDGKVQKRIGGNQDLYELLL